MHAVSAFVFALAIAACTDSADQPKLPVAPLVFETVRGPQRFTVEMATRPAQQERGLMFRKALAPNSGMLFDFRTEHKQAFWMKNTLIPLDMLFIRKDGTIARIAANAPPLSEKPISSNEPVRAVLEIPGGRAAELGLKPGDTVRQSIFGNMVP